MKIGLVWGGKRPVVSSFDLATKRKKANRVGHFQEKGPKRLISDKEIREMRAVYDFWGWEVSDIAKRYGLSIGSCRRYVDGVTRAGIQHSEEDLPDG